VNEPWMPKGYHTVTANMIVDDAEAAIAFLTRAFGAREHYRPEEMQRRMSAAGY
jgi:uncharacterized glyoxalase superfamily protein PhnB